MNKFTLMLTMGLLGTVALVSPSARAEFDVTASMDIHSVGDFYSPLATEGTWLQAGGYGRCWRPTGIDRGWRPYCNGQWVWTDCGWYWQSNEPWAWACYHYGNWYDDPNVGWVWVPGTQWAPAWVTWRTGDQYIGWAPMPPSGLSVASLGPQFMFVQASHFEDPIRPSVVIWNNPTVLSRTRVINTIRHETREFAGGERRTVVVNRGPGMEVVQRATGRRVHTVPIQEAVRRSPVPARRTANSENRIRRENLKQNNEQRSTPATAERHENAPRQEEAAPRGNQRQPNASRPARATPRERQTRPQENTPRQNEVTPQNSVPREVPPIPKGEERAPQRHLNREMPARPAPSELPDLQPDQVPHNAPGNAPRLQPREIPHNAPGGQPALNPDTGPRRPERTAPQQPPVQRERKESEK
jgi:hypothetical protein